MKIRTLLLSSLITCCTSFAFAADIVLDEIAAVVNEGVVLASELQQEADFLKLQAQTNRQSLPDDQVFFERVLERMIDQEIQRQQAARLGIAIDPSQVNQAIERIASQNNMEVQQFRNALRSQGFDYNYYRKSIEHELLLAQLIQRDVQPRIKVSSQEIDDFISASKKSGQNNRFRVLHILIAVPSTAPQAEVNAAIARANKVLASLRGGNDFAQVAAANSDGARALQGGDLGWRVLQELPDFVSKELPNMQIGDISEPIRSPNGFHIIKLEDKSDSAREVQNETLARHIFVTGTDGDQQLAELRRRINNNESFDALAAEFSEDPNSANNGGELPWFTSGQMPQEMEDVAATLEKGQLSQPFRTQYGWHLLQVLDRRQRETSDTVVRQQAEQTLRQRRMEQETERWIRQLRDETFIEVRTG
jgi:peptidyl-prolyl cis-trans isomerase SurA